MLGEDEEERMSHMSHAVHQENDTCLRACSRKKEARNLGFRGPRSHWRNPMSLDRENKKSFVSGHARSRCSENHLSELSHCVMLCDRT
jgi:hypothetical protein